MSARLALAGSCCQGFSEEKRARRILRSRPMTFSRSVWLWREAHDVRCEEREVKEAQNVPYIRGAWEKYFMGMNVILQEDADYS